MAVGLLVLAINRLARIGMDIVEGWLAGISGQGICKKAKLVLEARHLNAVCVTSCISIQKKKRFLAFFSLSWVPL